MGKVHILIILGLLNVSLIIGLGLVDTTRDTQTVSDKVFYDSETYSEAEILEQSTGNNVTITYEEHRTFGGKIITNIEELPWLAPILIFLAAAFLFTLTTVIVEMFTGSLIG